jgi:glycosyltransferase involved in cell wall biosynthesis
LYIAPQVESILSQTHPPLELVVGDDDSSDDTVAIIESVYARALALNAALPTRLKIVRRQPALGLVANFTATLAACAGELIALSDQDDVWMPGKLSALTAAFASDPQLLLAHSDARLVDQRGKPLNVGLLDALEANANERSRLSAGEALPILLRRNLVTGATVMLRRPLLDSAGPVPSEWLHDEWLAAIASILGHVQLIPEPLIDYRQHGSNQIGARKPTMADRFQRLSEPRTERARRMVDRAVLWADHARALEVAPAVQSQLDSKVAHELWRSRLPEARLWRFFPILGCFLSGRYGRYSRGAIDALRDAVQPVGQIRFR